jgi:hypothetical protein
MSTGLLGPKFALEGRVVTMNDALDVWKVQMVLPYRRRVRM